MRHVTRDTYFAEQDRIRQPYQSQYRAMYTSLFDAIVTDPVLMQIPLDDHMVHRGDGVFEMCKCIGRAVYNLNGHLVRLASSLSALGMRSPVSPARMEAIILETVLASGLDDAAIRIYVSRGPGSYGVNPYDCPNACLYVVVSCLAPAFMDQHPDGARVGYSRIPLKAPFFATMKSCNYLPNVLMKKEAIDRGLDFTVGFDQEGFLAEGPTENIGLVTGERKLLFPEADRVLCGTTMVRVLELAQALVAEGLLLEAGYARIDRQMLEAAEEVLITGTTTDVTHVAWVEGRSYPQVGPVTQSLQQRLLHDIRHEPMMRTGLDAPSVPGDASREGCGV